MPPRRARSLLLALLSGSFLVACASKEPAIVALPDGSGSGLALTVTHVVDGDTVDLRLPEGSTGRARLLGIDTPETVKPNTPVQCYGPEASARTKALLPAGSEVLVQRDTEARDRYGRLLVYLWRRNDGLFVNSTLVSEGYARTLSIEPNHAHRRDLSAQAADARAARRGLWGACDVGPDGKPAP